MMFIGIDTRKSHDKNKPGLVAVVTSSDSTGARSVHSNTCMVA